MIFEMPFSADDVKRSNTVATTPALYARSTHAGIEGLVYFAEDYIKPLLQGLLSRSDRDLAILGTYYRIVGYTVSILRLDAPWHFQSVSAGSRSILELYMDIVLLTRDQTSESTERFHAFTRVERFRVADRIVDFFDANPSEKQDDIAAQRALVSDAVAKAAIEALVDQFWGRDKKGDLIWPSHWSKYQDARSRARALDSSFEAMYVRFAYQLSWHVHAGAVGVGGISRENFDTFIGVAHKLVLETVTEVFTLVCKELGFSKVIPDFRDKIDFLRRIPGPRLVDLSLQELGEPLRFRFTEPGRAASPNP
jgi:hypothetical protein